MSAVENVYCIVNEKLKLSDETHKRYLGTPLAYGNAKAHAMRVTVYEDDENEADLTGVGVTGEVLLSNGNTVTPILGTVTGNVAEIILPASCYVSPGRFTASLDLTKNGETRTALWVTGTVEKKNSTSAIDPGTPVPNIDQAIGNANAAASAAQAAAALVPNIEDSLAKEFSTTKAYKKGDYVWRNHTLCMFKQDHAAGAWIGTDAMDVELADNVAELKSAVSNTEAALYVQKTASFVSESGVVRADTGENAPSQTSYRTSVDVSNAYRVSFFAHTYSSNYGYAFLDGNGTYISGAQTTTTGTMNILVPGNAKTFKVCWNSSETQNIILFCSGVADADDKIEFISSGVDEQTDFFLDEQFTKSEYNLIRCLSFEMENPDSGITLTSDRDYVSIQGQISSNQRMFIRVDISELSAGTYYFVPPYDLKGNNTYGVYFADKNKARLNSITYVNNLNFATLTLSEDITGIAYIVILLACTDNYTYNTSGYVFLNSSTKYISAGQEGYEPKYKPNNIQSVLNGKKWVAIGDSTTKGSTSQSDVPGLTYNWEKLVCDQTGMTCVNLGIPGSTTSGFYQAVGDIPADANIITIMGGINDMSQSVRTEDEVGYEYNSGTYPGSIRRLVKYIVQNFPNAKLILCSCIGGFSKTETGNFDLPVTNNIGKTIEDYANKCKEVAHELSMPFMDVFGDCGISTLNRTTYISDTVHPNVAGYKKLANVFLNYFNAHQDYIE